jgi:PAT family beta-lactamase induction signal transducer AmpG
VQGALFAYVLVFNNLYLREFGASAGQLGLLNGLLLVPFVLKIGLGIISDKVSLLGMGHRVPYIVLGLSLSIIGIIGAGLTPPVTRFGLFVTVAMFIALGISLFDTAIDGLAIDVTPRDEHSMVQSAMIIGRALGLVLLASAYGRLIVYAGWQAVFWVAAAITAIPLILILWVPEPDERPAEQLFDWSAVRLLWRPQIARLLAFGALYALVVYGAQAIVSLFANEALGATLIQVGDATALGGLGMLLGGALLTVIGRRISIWRQAIGVILLASIMLLGLALFTNLENVFGMTLLWGATLGMVELVYVTLAMKHADPRIGASTFAFYMAISNVGTGLGQSATTGLIDRVDYEVIFLALAAINLLAIPLLLKMRSKAGEHEQLMAETITA